VLNGESATMQVLTYKNLITDVEVSSDTVTNTGTSSQVFTQNNVIEEYTTGVQLTVTPVLTADKKFVILVNLYAPFGTRILGSNPCRRAGSRNAFAGRSDRYRQARDRVGSAYFE